MTKPSEKGLAVAGCRIVLIAIALAGLTGCASFFQPPEPRSLTASRAPSAAKVYAFKKAAPRSNTPETPSSERAASPAPVACGAKRSCGEIATCAEAYQLLNVCGLRQLDTGGQGVPCPALCGDTIETMTSRIKAQRSAAANR